MPPKERRKVEIVSFDTAELVEVFFNQKVPDDFWVIPLPRTIVHHHAYGGYTPFFRGLTEGKLFGTLCPDPICCAKNAKIWVPPYVYCPDCWTKMNWVEVNTEGAEIYTHSVVNQAGAGFMATCPCPIIALKIPGVWTHPMSYMSEFGEDEPYIGQSVRPVFRTEKPTRTILDISWVPID